MIHAARPRRFLAPHPLVTLGGLAAAVAVFLFGRSTGFQPAWAYVTFTIVFAAAFRAVSRRSARRQALRRERELEELRRKPVFGLDDGRP
jgi:hypothetical protein